MPDHDDEGPGDRTPLGQRIFDNPFLSISSTGKG